MARQAGDRLANLLAALALALSDDTASATQEITGLAGSAPAALLALNGFLDGCNVARLAEVFALTHSGAVRLATQLEAAGYLSRVQGVDRREVRLVLTDLGRTVAERAAAARLAVVRRATAGLGPAEQEHLELLVEGLVDRLVTERSQQRVGGTAGGAWWCRACDLVACGRPDGECPAFNAAAAVLAPSAERSESG